MLIIQKVFQKQRSKGNFLHKTLNNVFSENVIFNLRALGIINHVIEN